MASDPRVDLSLTRTACLLPARALGSDSDLYVMINAYWEDLTFTMQEGAVGQWQRVIDTGLESPLDFCEQDAELRVTSQSYLVKARSVVVLARA